MSWTHAVASVVGVLAAAVAFAAWYGLAVPGSSHRGPLPPRTAEERDLASRLEQHVIRIASVPHNLGHYQALEDAAHYIEDSLQGFGYAIERQVFEVERKPVRNIGASLDPETNDMLESIIVGAHYDSFGSAPGANDNGTGTAAVIELARLLKPDPPRGKRIRFVLFVNEEPPYYRTPDMGSWRYARQLSERGERVHGMLSLETMGYFSDRPGSQQYPLPFGLIYPSTGNFLAFVGLPASRSFLHEVIGTFRKLAAFPTLGGVAPDAIPGIGWSDHWAFREFGYHGVMLTDTAPFRYPHYHLPSDTPDKIDYASLARITKGLERVLREMAR